MSRPFDLSYALPDLPAWQRGLILLIERFYGQRGLYGAYRRFVDAGPACEHAWEDAAGCLGLDVRVNGRGILEIPREGLLIVVANHPFGLVDGVVVCAMLGRVRNDYRIFTWDLFSKAPRMADWLIPLDLEGSGRASRQMNVRNRRESLQWLRSGHCIVLFPAGMAAMSPSPSAPPREMPWGNLVARLARDSGATVLPVFVHGNNGRLFHAAGHLGYWARLALFLRETSRRIGGRVHLSIGRRVLAGELADRGDAGAQVAFLRRRTLEMRDRYAVPEECHGGDRGIDHATRIRIMPLEA